MAQKNFFPLRSESNPMIYAYEDTNPQYKGLLKIGYTCKDVQARVAQQYPTLRPGSLPYRIVFEGNAMRNDGSSFTDRDIHRYLRKQGFYNPKGEWFQCSKRDVKAAVLALKERIINEEQRTETFSMRPEQKQAVEKTAHYFTKDRKSVV